MGGDLHTCCLFVVEGAAHRALWPGFQVVVGKDRGDGEGGFDLGDGHADAVLSPSFEVNFSAEAASLERKVLKSHILLMQNMFNQCRPCHPRQHNTTHTFIKT